jgi:phthalate 4,5-dioxygenase oxygenase subunit
MREVPNPRLESEETPYGLRIATLRPINDRTTHVRITNMLFPHAFVIPLSREMTITQWHVPVDDTHCYWYSIFTSFTAPVDKATMRAQRLETHTLPDYAPLASRDNDWGYDSGEQTASTYTGMGMDINVHDQWAVESPGAIADRTQEHLGYSDRIITAARRMIFRAIDDVAEGRDPPGTIGAETLRGPPTIDAVGPAMGWENYWREQEAARRASAAWPTRTLQTA